MQFVGVCELKLCINVFFEAPYSYLAKKLKHRSEDVAKFLYIKYVEKFS